HLCGRNETDSIRRVLPESRALVSRKKEELVLFNRTTDRSAELIALDRIAFGGKRISGVKNSISYEFECVAVNIITTGFGYQADGSGGLQAVLSAGGAGFDFELLERIGKRHRHVTVRIRVVVVGPIERRIQPGVQTSGD